MPFRNTGTQEREVVDSNPNSPTQGQLRWVNSGESASCPVTPTNGPFPSALIRETVFRDNCQTGTSPEGYVYELAAGYYVSVVSQADADRVAQAYFDSTKQGQANQFDNCIADAESYTCEMTSDGCWTGFIRMQDGSSEFYTTQEQFNICYVERATTNPLQVCPIV